MSRTRAMIAILTTALAGGCGDDGPNPDDFEALDIGVCDPASGSFTSTIDHRYFPLVVGATLVLEGRDDGANVRVEWEVLDQTVDVAGVATRAVRVREYEDDELIEETLDYYAQAADGTVCYYGEDVDEYDGGELVGHPGQWRAGDGDNLPGIIMPGSSAGGVKFAQESAPGIAEDMSAVIGPVASHTVPAGTFEDVLELADWNPLEGDSGADAETKYYAAGVGIIVDDVVELTSYDIPND